MSIKPIDMQVNIGQMHEVAKNSQIRSEALVEQQHVLDKESSEKSNLKNSKLEENKKAEKTIILREENKERKRRDLLSEHREKDKSGHAHEEAPVAQDERMGRIIDVRK